MCVDPNNPWAIFEALNIVGIGDLDDWKGHFDKLIRNYDPYGLRLLFLVAYGNGAEQNFGKVWSDYWDIIRKYDPGKFRLNLASCTQDVLEQSDQTTRLYAARCSYYYGDTPDPSIPETRVYHIFVHLGS